MLNFLSNVFSIVATALILAVFFGTLTAMAIGLLRLIQFLAAM